MTSHPAHGHAKAHPHEKPHHPHWPLAALLFIFVFLLGLYSVHEAGTWIHIKTGARILTEGALPRVDPFSYTMAGRPWTTGSWLSDVLFSLLNKGFGARGLVIFKALIAAAAFAMLVPINPASPLTAVTVLGLGALASWTGLTENPAVFDLLMLSLLIRLLRPRKPFRWSVLAQAALIELVWVNLHGAGAPLGVWLAMLKTFKTSMRTTQRERLKYAAAPAAALLGLACNPLGLGVITQALGGLGNYGSSWQPLSVWFNLYSLFAVAGLASCFIVLQQEFFLTITAATLLVLSLLVPGWRTAYILASCPVIALAVGHYLAPKPVNLARFARWAALMAAFFWLHWTAIYAPLGTARGYGAVSLEGALHFLQDNGVRGRMFNEAESGDYIIGGSARPVFIDDRLSFYGENEAALVRDAARWPETLGQLTDGFHFDYALILNRRAGYPARVLDSDPAWRLAYADDAALIYLRRFGVNAPLFETAPPRLLAPNQLWPEALDALMKDPKLAPKALAELDRWVLEAPDAAQPLIWKAYALDRLSLAEKADRWISMAERRRANSDPELTAELGFFYARRGGNDQAEKLYLGAAQLAGRRGDSALESQILLQLAKTAAALGDGERAKGYEARARRLSAAVPED